MRIAHICQSYPPMVSGAALAVRQLAGGMAVAGHDVLVLAASDRQHAYVEQTGHLQVARLHSWRNPLRNSQRFLLWQPHMLYRRLHAFRPDVIHLHEPLLLGLSGIWTAHAIGVPSIMTLHQLPWLAAAYMPNAHRLNSMMESTAWAYGRWFTHHCDALVASAEPVADLVQHHGIRRPHVIGLGIDLENFVPRPPNPAEDQQLRRKYGLDPTLPVILHVGRIDTEKRVEQVIGAMARVLGEAKAQLLVVGNGRQLTVIKALSRRAGIGASCHFPGAVCREGDLPDLYRLAAAFVTASPIETFGYVVLEAMASGLPVVAVDAGSLPELVEHGVNGYLAAAGDEEALASHLIRLLREPEQAR